MYLLPLNADEAFKKVFENQNYSDNLIFSKIMNRLLVTHADNQDLINEMGLEAYQKAKKLGDEAEMRELREFFYWQIYDEIAGDWPERVSNAQNRAYDAEFQVIKLARELEKEKLEAQKALEKEKLEAQKALEKEKLEAQKALEKEKLEAQKEKLEGQKALEKEKQVKMAAKKALQEEKKKAKKLEQAQQKWLEQEQKRSKLLAEQEKLKLIKLMNNLLAVGLSTEMVAKSLEVSVEQVEILKKLKK
jgi:flagellar biosynthesis GTPase FlhF